MNIEKFEFFKNNFLKMIKNGRLNKLMDSPLFAILTGELFFGNLTIPIRLLAIVLAIIVKKSFISAVLALFFGYIYILWVMLEKIIQLINTTI